MTFSDYLINNVSYFGRTNFRNQRLLFGIKQADRLFHMYIFGKSGSGKTTLLKVLMEEDAQAKRGFCFVRATTAIPCTNSADNGIARSLIRQLAQFLL